MGMIATTLIMRLWNVLGMQQRFWPLTGMLAALVLLGCWAAPRAAWKDTEPGTGVMARDRLPLWQKLVMGLLLAILAVRFAGSALEIIWRPLYGWDAWMNWAPKAKVWFAHKSLVPFVSPGAWLHGASLKGAYALGAWKYPPAVPLIQLWMALGLGYWNDSLISLPWLLCGMALGLAFYGQARQVGGSPLSVLVFTYFLLSPPLLDTHVALGGYAELWMATVYGLAAMAFIQWLRGGDRKQGLLALIFILMCPLIKVPGLVWMLTFIPALLVFWLPRKVLWALLALVGVGVIAVVINGGVQFALPGIGKIHIGFHELSLPYLGVYRFQFHPVWQAFLDSFWVLDNWNLFWYLWVGVFVLCLQHLFCKPYLTASTTLVAMAFAFIFLVFFFTKRYVWALHYTQINRAVLHMIPLLMFYAFILLQERVVAKRCVTVLIDSTRKGEVQ